MLYAVGTDPADHHERRIPDLTARQGGDVPLSFPYLLRGHPRLVRRRRTGPANERQPALELLLGAVEDALVAEATVTADSADVEKLQRLRDSLIGELEAAPER